VRTCEHCFSQRGDDDARETADFLKLWVFGEILWLPLPDRDSPVWPAVSLSTASRQGPADSFLRLFTEQGWGRDPWLQFAAVTVEAAING
jgi:hypothetical protein